MEAPRCSALVDRSSIDPMKCGTALSLFRKALPCIVSHKYRSPRAELLMGADDPRVAKPSLVEGGLSLEKALAILGLNVE